MSVQLEKQRTRSDTGAESSVSSEHEDQDMTPLERAASTVESYPQGTKLAMILLSIYLSVFLVALDRTIIATALPQITDQFQSFGDIGWYNAAFLLPSTALQLFYGRMYTFYSPKWIFMSLIFVFEVGSAVCGAAPNSIGFILGRAVSGIGAGAIFNGAMILMMYAVPLNKRPMYMGFLGAVFGVASVAGPLLGGVFTTKVSWRWCFYINLPVGAIVMVFLYFAIDDTAPAFANLSIKEKIARIDIPGTLILVPCIVCLLLALQWGGSTYAWNSGRIIALLVLFGVLLIVFIGIQFYQKERATVPPRIAKQRTIASGFFYSFCLGSSFMLMVYYLSIWFQAIKGDSAIVSGYSTLPFILSLVIASIMSGVFVTKVGWYNPPILVGAVLAAVGAGLITTFTRTTAHPMWIGCQVLYGFGIGLGLQQTNIAAQTVLDKKDAPTGVSLVFLGQGLGGAISVAIGQNLLNRELINGIKSLGSDINPAAVVSTGATELRNVFNGAQLDELLTVYNQAIVKTFQTALAFACICILGGLAMEWRSTKGKQPVKKDVEKAQVVDESQEVVKETTV